MHRLPAIRTTPSALQRGFATGTEEFFLLICDSVDLSFRHTHACHDEFAQFPALVTRRGSCRGCSIRQIRKTGSDGALLQGPAANNGLRRRSHGPTGLSTGASGSTGVTGATGGSTKKIVKRYLDKTLARKSSTFVAPA